MYLEEKSMTPSPMDYTPAYCEAVRRGCETKMDNIDKKVDKVDARMWSLIILAGSNLLASIGGLVFYLISQSQNHETIKHLVTAIPSTIVK